MQGVLQCELEVDDKENRDALEAGLKVFADTMNSEQGLDVDAELQGNFEREAVSKKRGVHCQLYGNLDISGNEFPNTLEEVESLWRKFPGKLLTCIDAFTCLNMYRSVRRSISRT